MAMWGLALFYLALGSFLLWVGADRLAQTMYDFAQKISHLRFGWSILGAMLGAHYLFVELCPVDG